MKGVRKRHCSVHYSSLLLLLIIILGSAFLLIYRGRQNVNQEILSLQKASLLLKDSLQDASLRLKDSLQDASLRLKDQLPEEVNTLQAVDPLSLKASTILDSKTLSTLNLDDYFSIYPISDELFQRMYGNSFKENCTIPRTDLRYIRLLYYGFDTQTHIGELVVNRSIAEDILHIFRKLYDANYPIEQMVLIDDYQGDDDASMADNNTSCFNFRVVENTTKLSKHAYGLAIDVNPLYNPYTKTKDGNTIVSPVEASPYTDRTLDCPYFINGEDFCSITFMKYGFTWGGSWSSCKDYQHFQIDK